MNETLFSQSWYRVAELQPRLRSHVHILKHQYRGEDWYIIQDRFTGRYHRFSVEAYQVIGLMNGRRTLEQIWQKAGLELGDHMPTQDEIIHLVSMLFRADLLQSSIVPDFKDLESRYKKGKRNKFLMNLRSPMSVRFPLIDPDRFLIVTYPFVKPLLGWTGAACWLIVICAAFLLSFMHWSDLTENVTDALFSLQNVFWITLLYPLLKAMHELGHGYMVKKWGGEVHEMGIMLLVFFPIPYVEASSSIAFENKYHRMAVGAAGILVELFSAAIAFFVWLSVEPGVARAIAFNTMLIAGVSTLLFNGNPLLRFDAYYVLADFLEIPNLDQRSNKYIGYLCKRFFLGVATEEPDTEKAGEAAWLCIYAVASFVYRIFLSIRIILFVATKFFFIGSVLAVWAGYIMLLKPIVRVVRYLVQDRNMKRKRLRIFGVVVVPIAVLMAMIFFFPWPYSTFCEGVTWVPDEAQVYSGVDGFVAELHVADVSAVERGQLMVTMDNIELSMEVKQLELMRDEYQARYEKVFQTDRTEAALIEDELDRIHAELDRAYERYQALRIISPLQGYFIFKDPVSLQGRFLRRGTLLGYVLNNKVLIRVVVPQADIEKVRQDVQRIEIRLASDINKTFMAKIIGEVPAASRSLPSAVLSLEGGGLYALDPRQPDSLRVIENLFQFDLAMESQQVIRIDERVFVRFIHHPEPLVYRWFRGLRRLLLSKFSF